MELYTKRNGERLGRRNLYRHVESERADASKLISDTLRNRLIQQLKYLISSANYLESFLVVKNERREETYLHSKTLSEISLRELGYDMTSIIDPDDLQFKTEHISDAKFFDLVELIIIFSKPDTREDLVSRINDIFKQEGGEFSIHGYMIVSTESEGLRSIAPIIKEKVLKEKIREYYRSRIVSRVNYEYLAKISAEILQLLFSSPVSKKKTEKYAIDLCTKVATTWTSSEKVKNLANLLSDTVKNAKNLSNEISDVRHTDRSTIPVDTPNIYKLITVKNINLAELVILSLPENYISEQDPESLKNEYLEKYQVNKDSGWVVKKKEQGDEIDINDIPF